ncbi:MAG: 50S ribosomal protein L11, partial [Firmicutes bacterium]|nr:50S ribosomal protein L11 [Bacillota bacterium]
TTKVGHISRAALKKIAEYKLPDLNANDIEAAMKIVAGSARNMGITIDD